MIVTAKSETERKLEFDVDHVSGGVELWFEHMSRLYDFEPMSSEFNTGRFESRGFHNARGVLAESSYDRQFVRATKNHASRIGNYIFVLRFKTGGAIGNCEDTPFTYRPGDIIINDYGREYNGVHFASSIQGVYFDKADLGLDACAPLPVLTYSSGSTMAKLIHNEMNGLFIPLMSGCTMLHVDRFERFTSCVKLAIQGAPPEGDCRVRAREALKDLISRHIECHLPSPDLSTSSLLREFGVSRATLYRMFEAEGGVRNHIATRRLYRAVSDLSRRPHVRGKIHEVAERWGFTSDANFSRSVRRLFGTPPGNLFNPACLCNER